jgi:hypothetical protein
MYLKINTIIFFFALEYVKKVKNCKLDVALILAFVNGQFIPFHVENVPTYKSWVRISILENDSYSCERLVCTLLTKYLLSTFREITSSLVRFDINKYTIKTIQPITMLALQAVCTCVK